MSHVSLLKTIPDFLSQPAGIAALASIGIHGVIAFMLPLMPMETKTTKEVKTAKTVEVVELNQADQQRLPQTNSPKVALNSPGNLQSQVSLPEFATKPTPLPPPLPPSSTQVVLPPLPTSPGSLGIDALPKTTNNSSFRIRPTDRFQARPSLSTRIANVNPSRQRIAFKAPKSNSNARPAPISPLEIDPQINSLQTSNNLPDLSPAGLPSGLPNKPVETARGITSVSGLPSSNEVSKNFPGRPEVINNPSNSTQTQQSVNPIGETKPIDRLAFANNSQVPKSKVKPPNLKPPNKVITEAELFAKIQQKTPNLEMQAVPLQPRLDLPQGEKGTNVKGGLVVDGEGRIDFFELLDKSLSSNLKVAVRDHFRNYFQKNPVKANGKPKYFSFNVVFEPSNGQASSASQGLRKRLDNIRDNRELKSNPLSSSEVSTPKKSSSPSPLSLQSVIITDRPGDAPRSNQKSPSGVLSKRLQNVVVNRQDDSKNNNQVSSSSPEEEKNLIQKLRKIREERKASDSK